MESRITVRLSGSEESGVKSIVCVNDVTDAVMSACGFAKPAVDETFRPHPGSEIHNRAIRLVQ
jgi:hypothetical protein